MRCYNTRMIAIYIYMLFSRTGICGIIYESITGIIPLSRYYELLLT